MPPKIKEVDLFLATRSDTPAVTLAQGLSGIKIDLSDATEAEIAALKVAFRLDGPSPKSIFLGFGRAGGFLPAGVGESLFRKMNGKSTDKIRDVLAPALLQKILSAALAESSSPPAET